MRPQQGTKRSHLKKRTLPLPLEIKYLPSQQTARARITVRETEDERIVRWSLRPGGVAAKATTPEDPWDLQEKFLSFELSPERLEQARNRFSFILPGALMQLVNPGQEVTEGAIDGLILDELKEWQSLLRTAQTIQKDRWLELAAEFPSAKVDLLCQPLPLIVELRDGLPVGVIHCDNPLKALIATVWVDAVLGAERRFCACRGCTNRPFKVKRRNQIYCNDDCKHLQIVRNIREKKRMEALLTKNLENLQEEK